MDPADATTTGRSLADHPLPERDAVADNARLEGMNGLFQAARSRARARGYRNETNFIAMIYLIGSPVGRMLDHTKST